MINARVLVGLSLVMPLLYLLWKKDIKLRMSLPLLMLLLYCLYQCVRFSLHKWVFLPGEDQTLTLYYQGMMQWCFVVLIYFVSVTAFNQRGQFWKIMALYSGLGFFLSMNAIPALYKYSKSFYPLGDYELVFFHPLFYKVQFLGEYIFGKFAHPNYTGDVIALGFFAALAAVFCLFVQLCDGKQDQNASVEEDARAKQAVTLLLFLLISFVLAATIFLLNSRGSIVCFILGCLVYLVGFCCKYPSRRSVFFVIVFIFGGLCFLGWRGNLQKAWFEVLTLQKEYENTSSDKKTSYSTNIEGGKRALMMYQDHSLWGVGTGGYSDHAKNYGTLEQTEQFILADHQSMNHYLQKLAEEGLGALLYFLFLVFYFIEAILRCLRMKSRYQFLIGFAFVVAAGMIYGHATFNHLLEHYTFVLLIFSTMGLGLSALQSNLKHR